MRQRSLILTLSLALVFSSLLPHPLPAQEEPYDVVITGGKVVDGTGNAWFYGDVGIRGDRMARIAPAGMLANAAAKERINARGLVVAPGFIDIQSHSRDAFLDGDGRVISKITQGITTEIMGEGWTNAPANDRTIAMSRLLDDPVAVKRAQEFAGPRGFNTWLEAMHSRGVSPNIGSFVGSATIRAYVKGLEQGPPTPAELETMRQLVRDAMQSGAFGVATALIYPPDNFVSTEDLIELAKAMAPYGGVYITHMRSEADKFLEAIDEAIRIGKEGGVPVEIYHLKAGGRRNWHKAALAVARINAARAEGQDVAADMYLYTAGGTSLSACLPPWAAAGGKLLDNLRDAEMRARIRAEILQQTSDWENLCELSTPEGVLLSGFKREENAALNGKRLSEIASVRGKDWIETAMDLISEEDNRVGGVYFLMTEGNVKLQLTQPWIKFGTDAGGHDPEKAKDLTHPRAYGNFPRLLGKYVREERVLTLEDAVRKASAAVAQRLSLRDRGLLREGMFADVVVFDAERIADRATFEQPHQLSVGMRHVLVNGVAVLRDGQHTGAKPGRIVRGPGYKREN
ncbi:MAG: N-acyl-D-amino-acid deacylase family protein [Candidatus Acidiferrales bacterium]